MNKEPETILFKFSTAFQLLNGLAYLDFLSKKKIKTDLILCYNDYWKKNNISPHYISFAVNKGAKIATLEEFYNIEKKLRSEKKIYKKLIINHTFQNPLSKIKKISIDDGIGAYRTNALSMISAFIKERNITNSSHMSCIKMIFIFLLKNVLSKVFPAERFAVFARVNPLAINTNYIFHAKAVLEELRNTHAATAPFNNCPNRFVLFLSQPAVELNWISPEKYRILIEKLVAWAATNQGSALLVKRHPADNFDYEKTPCISFSGMAEELFFSEKISSVVSINSTSSITGKILFGIPSFTLDINNNLIADNRVLSEMFSKYTQKINL